MSKELSSETIRGILLGRDFERERIIGLLDNWKCGHPDCDGDISEVCYPKYDLIGLIEGKKIVR